MSARSVEYQVERVRLGRHLSRSAVRQLLTDHAEYGGWELPGCAAIATAPGTSGSAARSSGSVGGAAV